MELHEGDVVKHKLGFNIVVVKINPVVDLDTETRIDGILGRFLDDGVLCECEFKWCEIAE